MSVDLHALPAVDPDALATLEAILVKAFETGDESGLDVLGYGEISCVLRLDSPEGALAAKRLPPFADGGQLGAYQGCFEGYLQNLSARGIAVVPSALETVRTADGRLAAWCVQPALPPGSLLTDRFASCPIDETVALFGRLLDHVQDTVDRTLGLDGQISNWADVDGQLMYLDVTTPMMRDAEGAERLDTSLFLASLPAALRPFVRRFMLRDILDKYYEPRGVVLDLLGNLHKERLAHLIAELLDHANARLDEPLTEDEIARYYRSDARTWALLQRLRRMDRAWQRGIRSRPYPFLLPGEIRR